MPDYDLTGLSPRSFEQLIQAISLKVVSPTTIIFGDGTDGGREATFQGKTNYNSDKPWDGYIVFQAKFSQRPNNNTKKDGDWAISQLKKELDDFANPEKRRKKPEYYIFITNVVLTPVLEKGSKDKAYKLFEDYQDTVPLKGYDIWDYDKICRFIDGNEDIRRAYAAWITPGDVLTEVIEMLSFKRPDFKTVIASFLKKELQSDLYANLEQAGHSSEDKIPLASVFVDLPIAGRQISEASRSEQRENIIADLVKNAKQKFDYNSLLSTSNRNDLVHGVIDIKQVLKVGKWVVIGGPGQGKTTVGQFLCQLFRAAILKEISDLRDLEVEKDLQKFETQCEQENICLPLVRRFPFRIVLNEFAAVLASNDSINSVLDYIALCIRKRTSKEIDAEDIRQWLAHYPWLIVLDGLDEVPASSNRNDVLTAIRDFGIDGNELNADIMMVATTRPQGYNDDFNTDFYRHVWLAPLSTEQALHYARRLLGLRYGNDEERQEKIVSRLERASNDDFTSRLMQSPLQVTIMTVLLNKTGQAPKDRWSLFNKYYDIIYDREVEREIPASDILRDYKADIDSIHYQVGLLLQVQSERSGKTDARLSVEEFTTLVRSRLAEEGHENKECEALTKQIIDAAANRLVFLVGLEQDIVGFEVRSLQEFMASEAIMNGSDEQIRNRLKEIIPIISWRNVVLFAIGKCFARNEKEHLRDLIHTECAALNDLDDLNIACLSGSRLALDILEDGSVTHKPKFLKLFARLALRLLDIPPDNFHVRLAHVCLESITHIYREEVEKRISNLDCYQSFGAWTCLLQLINLDLEWAIQLGDQYWFDDTHKQLRIISCFLQLNIVILDNKQWIAKKIDYVIPRVSPVTASNYFPLYENELFDLKIQESTRQFISALESQRSDDFFAPIEHDHHLFPSFADTKTINNTWALYYIPSIVFPSLMHEEDYLEDCLLFKRRFFAQLSKIQDINYYWIAYKYATDFWLNPSPKLLNKVLEYIAQHYDEELIDWIINLVPWQIYECLLAAGNARELLAIAKSVKDGDLGSYEDWKEAETRWNKSGIVAEDFICSHSKNLPFNSDIGKIGFLWNKKMWIKYARYDDEIDYKSYYSLILSELIDLYPNVSSANIKITLSKIVLYLFNDDEVKQNFLRESKSKDYNFIKEIISQNTNNYISQEKTETIFSIYKTNNDYDLIQLINTIGERARFEYYISLRKYEEQFQIYTGLFDCFKNKRKLIGVLNILSYLYPDHKVNQLLSRIYPELINFNNFTETKIKEATIIISLSRKEWSKDDINEVISYGIDYIDQFPRIIPRIIIMIEKKLFVPFISELFLQQLYTRLPKSQWECLSRVDRSTNEQLTTKTSNLNDKSKWSQLGLPSGASSLLPE